ncbi:MerR family DNA-binding transcriptional regulator [Desulfotomaculum copahuensis]|nr:MerR family DNA-binding transcriptional regulator [Desulfotomaculum copahuensis]
MTLRRWEKAGKIQCIRTPSGQRRYPRSEILRLLGENQPRGNRVVIYVMKNAKVWTAYSKWPAKAKSIW